MVRARTRFASRWSSAAEAAHATHARVEGRGVAGAHRVPAHFDETLEQRRFEALLGLLAHGLVLVGPGSLPTLEVRAPAFQRAPIARHIRVHVLRIGCHVTEPLGYSDTGLAQRHGSVVCAATTAARPVERSGVDSSRQPFATARTWLQWRADSRSAIHGATLAPELEWRTKRGHSNEHDRPDAF